jgi:hypothetical protein
MPRSGLEPTVRIDICESAVLNHCALKASCTSRNNIQLIVPRSARCFYSTMVKHCALTKINSVTVGTERPRPGMRNVSSSPKYAAGGWNILVSFVRAPQGNYGNREVKPCPGQDSNPRSESTFVRAQCLTIVL